MAVAEARSADVGAPDEGIGRVFRNNSLSIVMFGLFSLSLLGQSVAGYQEYSDEQRQHGEAPVGYLAYHGTGHFGEAVFENWESEFLQMGMYVVLTIFLRQKGSPESKPVATPHSKTGND